MKKIYSLFVVITFVFGMQELIAQSVWINELHYDNSGTDADEGVEVAGTAGTDLSCYTIYLYNGNGNIAYDSLTLSGTIDDEGCGYGAVWFAIAGIQNGAPDGLGLYNNCTSTPLYFLSYEGSMTAANSVFNGMTSEEIPAEIGSPLGEDLQLIGIGTSYGDFTWDTATVAASLGTLNVNQYLCGGPVDTLVTFTTSAATIQEGIGSYTLLLELNQVVGTSSTIDVALLSGPGANLSNTFPTTVTFAAGTDTASLVVSIIDDALIEANDTFEFILENPSSNLTLGSDSIFTLIAEDDDTPLPVYTIGQVNTVDTLGSPDSLNVDCEIQNAVVMGINYADAPDVSFYIHDATGGMGVYNPAGSAGYTVNEGDLITVKGTVGFFNGLTQLVNITSITVTGTGTLPTPTVLSAPLSESDESELVTLSNVTVVDQSDWNTGVGSGFTVDVTDGTNTYAVRIDKSTDLYSMALPGCVLDVTGIGSQFDNSSPYTSGYQLLPRYAADITVIEACVTPTYTIAEATEVDANGAAVLNGTVLSLKGIITSPDFRELQSNGTEFSFSDGTGGIWAFTTDSTISFTPVVGDSVIVYGNIGQSSGVTRIYIDSVMSLGAATPLSPVIITSALAENHEAELITIEHLTLSSAWQSSGPSYNVNATSDGGVTYSIRVDADRAELFTVPLTTANKFTLTGIGTQYDPTSPFSEGYQVLPRFASDIVIETVGIHEITLDNMSVSPIPADNALNVAFNYHTSETVNFEIIDVLGHVVLSNNVNVSAGYNKNTLDVSSLSNGFYVLKIQTLDGVSTTNVMIK